jgi:KUP system potassium uptake protein
MFYGDALITPAISVMSAVEGLKAVPGLDGQIDPFLLPIAIGILVGLFAIQSRGTGVMGRFFGPITTIWFITMGDARRDRRSLPIPRSSQALSPVHAVSFMIDHHFLTFIVLGSVFLAVTGAEALYADMGHFGRGPIRTAWVGLVLPALTLNYLGQGAFVIANLDRLNEEYQTAADAARAVGAETVQFDFSPFFEMAPDMLRLPLVILATAATVIASQAVISGAFSLTQQAIQLGLLPRMEIRRTSETQAGQIYMPQINWLLLAGVLIADSGVRLIDPPRCGLRYLDHRRDADEHVHDVHRYLEAVEATDDPGGGCRYAVCDHRKHFPRVESAARVVRRLRAAAVGGGLILVDVDVGARHAAAHRNHGATNRWRSCSRRLSHHPPHRVRGAAIFLTGDPDVAPAALMHNLKHNQVLHEQIIILTVKTMNAPRAPESERVKVEDYMPDVKRVTLTFGFMETPNVVKALTEARKHGLKFDIMKTSFFLSRRTIVPSEKSGMPLWQDHLFIFLARNATNATDFFHIPSGRAVELGNQVMV